MQIQALIILVQSQVFDVNLLPVHLGGKVQLQYDPHSLDPVTCEQEQGS